MTSAVDRTSDFIRSVQLSRAKLKDDNNLETSVETGHSETSLVVHNFKRAVLEKSPFLNSHDNLVTIPLNDPQRQRNNAMHERSKFMRAAAAISQDLSQTFGKLEQLNKLALSQTLFDDHSSEIQQLTYIVKESMANMNHRIAELSNLSKSQAKTGGKQRASHTNSVLMGLQMRLTKMSEQFRGLLERRSEVIRTQSARKGKYTSLDLDPASTNHTQASKRTIVPSLLLEDEQRARQSARRNQDDLLNGLNMDTQIESQVQDVKVGVTDQMNHYLSSRSDTMRSIEHTIVELGQIFQQLATMVHEQDESIRRIDANVDEASTSIEAAHSELVRYFRSISSSRWLMIKVFFVLLAFFIIFVVFFA